MGRCFLCEPPTDVDDEHLLGHMLVEHNLDVDKEVEKWPDGEWVVHDNALEPDDFAGPGAAA
jgi:hypothetical protein